MAGRKAEVTRDPHAGRTVLVTGAGGSIGSALARAILEEGPRRLLLLESSEQSLHEIDSELVHDGETVAILGDVGDPELLDEVFLEHSPETIYHAAAFKQVPMMERHPVAAARNNALATASLVRAAERSFVSRLVLVSTDKAAKPASVMGATKRVAERIVLELSGGGSAMRAVRLGNVLNSRGSVAPLFRRQIEAGGPVTVSHPEVRRYFMTLEDAVDAILSTGRMAEGGLYVPVLEGETLILDLARRMMEAAGRGDVPVVFTNLRPGDKMSEHLLREGESTSSTADPRLLLVTPGAPEEDDLEEKLRALAERVERRDGAGVIRCLAALVSDYVPSAEALSRSSRCAGAVSE